MSANREAALEQQIAQQASKNIQLEQELVDFLRHGREGSPERPPPRIGWLLFSASTGARTASPYT